MITYQKYLANLHTKFTPDQLISEVVIEATNCDVLSKRRIIAGEASEVYDIETKKGNIIVRIARGNSPQYEQDEWGLKGYKEVFGEFNINSEVAEFYLKTRVISKTHIF